MKKKALLISVGGSPEPVIKSIDLNKPDYICFFASKETKESIEALILPRISINLVYRDIIIVNDSNDIKECFEKIYKKIPEVMKKWNEPFLTVDYTGGTKNMSVAVALATINYTSDFSYIGGSKRTKDGVGIVEDGCEERVVSQNPWDVLGVEKKKKVEFLFNYFRFESAKEEIIQMIDKIEDDQQDMWKAFFNIVDAYSFWDRFNHNQAKNILQKNINKFSEYWKGKGELKEFLKLLNKNLEFLNSLNIKDKIADINHIYDLIANAVRRGEEGKYDDATARLYRALEAFSQYRLLSSYKIDTSNIQLKDIKDEKLKEEIKKKCSLNKNKSGYQVPLYKGYEILNDLGDEVGKNFIENYSCGLKLEAILNTRNNSILAHGKDPVKEETYKKLYETLLKITEINREDLPIFPKLEFN